jgi:phage terminase large subunit
VLDPIIQIPDKLFPILESNERFIDIYGGRGSGKSWAIAAKLIGKAYESKCRILCTREIQNTIKDSVHKLLSDTIEKYKLESVFTIKNDSIISDEGSEFIFKGLLRNPQDIKSMEGIDYCWVEEAHSVSRRSLETLIPTIRKENSQIIFSYNPTNDDDPIHIDYTISDKPNVLKIECNYTDNPWFPDVLKNEMEWDRKHDIDKYFHVWLGQCVKHSNAQVFYKKWVIEDFEAPKGMFFYLGADWGFSQDPSTLIRCFIVDNKLYIDYEFYEIGVDIDLLPIRFLNIPGSIDYPIIADSARPDTISYMQRHGFPKMTKSAKGKGSVEDGIAFLRSFDKIIIHSRCKHTIDEFRLYCYQIDPKTETISNKLEDKNNHIIDALRYACENLMRKNYGRVIQTSARPAQRINVKNEFKGWVFE